MKRLLSIVLILVLAVSLTACGSSVSTEKTNGGGQKSVSDVLNQSSEDQPTTGFNFVYGDSSDNEVVYPELDYDAECDLTKLGSTMVYSEVSNMMTTPENYLGKTVKASGLFDVYTDVNTGNLYYACIIKDATACCANGLEFVLDGDFSYPDDYPEVNTPITIGGVFETYSEGEATYCRLKNAKMSV